MDYHRIPLLIDPVAFRICGVGATWYTLSYVTGTFVTYSLARYRIAKSKYPVINLQLLHEFLYYLIPGILLGGRLGYFLLYYPKMFVLSPIEIISPFGPWRGMSQHGGVIGVIFAAILFARNHRKNFYDFMDFMIPPAAQALFWGRIMGNFMSGGLPGRPTDLPFGMYFPNAGEMVLRHPSPLYQGLAEGLLPFLFLWVIKDKIRIRGGIFSFWFILHGTLRFGTEFFREPDGFIGLYLGVFTKGQLFCLCEIIFGIATFLALHFRNRTGRRDPFQIIKTTPLAIRTGDREHVKK